MRRYKSKPKIEYTKPPIDKQCMQAYDMSSKGYFSLVWGKYNKLLYIYFITKSYKYLQV